ncbi:MAG: DUF2271 domain-containing protein [Treponema sp.]|nr:DUF2271 domain-containing protein [Treponema sp.]
MKKAIFTLVLTILILVSCTGTKHAKQTAEVSQQDKVVELTFDFNRQSGHATNQFAVWIEDLNGQHVKTIYATRFTANGGWRRRPNSIPIWVRQSGTADMTREQIDAVSSATPRTGLLTYVWDGKNSIGIPVPDGVYFLILEGTLRWENQVIYRAPIVLGQGTAIAEIDAEYLGEAAAERSMISDVRVKVLR